VARLVLNEQVFHLRARCCRADAREASGSISVALAPARQTTGAGFAQASGGRRSGRRHQL